MHLDVVHVPEIGGTAFAKSELERPVGKRAGGG